MAKPVYRDPFGDVIRYAKAPDRSETIDVVARSRNMTCAEWEASVEHRKITVDWKDERGGYTYEGCSGSEPMARTLPAPVEGGGNPLIISTKSPSAAPVAEIDVRDIPETPETGSGGERAQSPAQVTSGGLSAISDNRWVWILALVAGFALIQRMK